MSAKLEERFKAILESTQILQVITCQETGGQVTALCRLKDGTAEVWSEPEGLIHYLLRQERDWQTHICKRYLLKGEDKAKAEVVFGWCVSVAAQDLPGVIEEIGTLVALFIGERSLAGADLIEMPLPGVHVPDRNAPSGEYKGLPYGGASKIGGGGSQTRR